MCQLCTKLARKVAEMESAYKIAKEGLLEILKEVDKSLEERKVKQPSCGAWRGDEIALQLKITKRKLREKE